MTETRSWPELGEELGRKALDVMETTLVRYQDGELSREEVILVVNTIFDTISGLAKWEITDGIYQIRKELEDE